MFKKKIVTLLTVMLLSVIALTSCGNDDTVTEDMTSTEEALSVAIVVEGGLGDRSFYDSSNEGLQRAIEELGIRGNVLECKDDATIFYDQLVQAANSSDIIVAAGFALYDALQEVAEMHQDKTFIYVDNVVEGFDNITNILYKENEGSFLAGALAALQSETGIIGFVGGMDIPVIRNFEIGYIEGAKYINPDIKVESIFVEDFEDPAKGKEGGLVLIDKGADIIFSVAGKTGQGVFEAAAETDNFVIGVDSDQRYINPDVIIASMIKEIGLSIYNSIEEIQNNDFAYGTTITYDLEKGGIDMAYGDDTMPKIVTEENKEIINELKASIISGEIQVPSVY